MRVLLIFLVLVSSLGILTAASPARAWYDRYGRWHPNYYRPYHPPAYYRPPGYYGPRIYAPPPVYLPPPYYRPPPVFYPTPY